MVSVLREWDGVLTQEELLIAGVDGGSEFLHLIAGVVHIEFPAYVPAGTIQHRGQRVAQNATAGVAQVHGSGGVGGNEFHIHRPSGTVGNTAIIRAFFPDGGEDCAIPGTVKHEVDEAGTGNRDRREKAAVEIAVLRQRLSDLPRGHPQCFRADHGVVCGIIAVGNVLGDLHRARKNGSGGKRSGGDSRFICAAQDLSGVFFCQFN